MVNIINVAGSDTGLAIFILETDAGNRFNCRPEGTQSNRKERDELSARWENLNREVEKKFDYRADRCFDPTAFASKISISVIFDEDLYRASQIEFVEGILQKVVPLFQSELSKMLNRPKY